MLCAVISVGAVHVWLFAFTKRCRLSRLNARAVTNGGTTATAAARAEINIRKNHNLLCHWTTTTSERTAKKNAPKKCKLNVSCIPSRPLSRPVRTHFYRENKINTRRDQPTKNKKNTPIQCEMKRAFLLVSVSLIRFECEPKCIHGILLLI